MEEMTITSISRSAIQGEYDGKQIRIEGEAYLPGYGSPSFVAYSSTLSVASKNVAITLDTTQKATILNALVEAMVLRNQTIELEP